jgi:phenylalanyl-tRNA synthetase alpha chain
MNRELPPEQAKLLLGLEPGTARRVPELAQSLQLDQAQVAAAAVLLAQEGLCAVREEPYREWVLKDQGREAIRSGLPERRVLQALLDHDGAGTMVEVAAWSGLAAKEVGQAIKGLALRDWATKDGAALRLTEHGRTASQVRQADESALILLQRAGESAGAPRLTEEELTNAGCDVEQARKLLGLRSPLVEIREKNHRWVSLTPEGETLRAAGVQSKPEVTLLTPELLAGGEWRNVRFKPYDVNLNTEPKYPGKPHPMMRTIAEARRAFLTMGFEEWHSPLVESAFWDFDALFQPQDHPAREMQDTFYVARPARTPLPADGALVERVRSTHENGGTTGSLGWQYTWKAETAERNVLRTHNTATTIRALAALKKGPRKVFAIGRVFRREAITYKHLPVFFHLDGIVIDAKASFSSLLGTLAAFYREMGFSKLEFRPSFFPYTEPSLEIFAWYEERQDWIEMGGAGIFRPEVTEPLGCSEPVLAWGLGVDRLAMLRYGMSDIRDLYLVDVEWLKGVPQCR